MADGARGNGNGGGSNGASVFGRFGAGDSLRRDDVVRHQRTQEFDSSLSVGGSRYTERCVDDGEHKCGTTDSLPKRNRLTLDERRALRRQIQDAGQELYIPAK